MPYYAGTNMKRPKRQVLLIGVLLAATAGLSVSGLFLSRTLAGDPAIPRPGQTTVGPPKSSGQAASRPAPAEQLHPIDKMVQENERQYGACATTAEVYAKATALWDGEMNKHYKRLMSTLPAKSRPQLRKAQRAWIEYRNTQSEFLEGYYQELFGDPGGTLGTMYQAFLARDLMLLTKQRAEEMRSLLDLTATKSGLAE